MLLAAAACEERIRARSGYYDTSRCLDGFESMHFSLRAEPANDPATAEFRLIATPVSPAPDDYCGGLSLDQSGRRGVSGDQQNLDRCWGGR